MDLPSWFGDAMLVVGMVGAAATVVWAALSLRRNNRDR
jgi:hypothetical protein